MSLAPPRSAIVYASYTHKHHWILMALLWCTVVSMEAGPVRSCLLTSYIRSDVYNDLEINWLYFQLSGCLGVCVQNGSVSRVCVHTHHPPPDQRHTPWTQKQTAPGPRGRDPPPPCGETTPVKTLPCLKLCLRVVGTQTHWPESATVRCCTVHRAPPRQTERVLDFPSRDNMYESQRIYLTACLPWLFLCDKKLPVTKSTHRDWT